MNKPLVASCSEFLVYVQKEVAKSTKGRRARYTEEVRLATQLAGAYIANGDINNAYSVVRVVGRNLGSNRWPDYRDTLDVVFVDHVTTKMIIGKCGERVPFDRVLVMRAKGVKHE